MQDPKQRAEEASIAEIVITEGMRQAGLKVLYATDDFPHNYVDWVFEVMAELSPQFRPEGFKAASHVDD